MNLKLTLAKLFLKSPRRLQLFLARVGFKIFVKKKRLELREFMRQ